jgi:hypothetical protein
VPLDANSQANALENTQSHFGLAIKQERQVGGSMLSSRGCQDNKKAKIDPQEPVTNYL